MALAVVRSVGTARRLRSPHELEDFEQELVDQYSLALAAAGCTDSYVSSIRAATFEFVRFLGSPVWTAGAEDVDRFLIHLRRDRGQAKQTVQNKAAGLAGFFDFLVVRYQGDVHALTGHVLTQPVDEFNRPSSAEVGRVRVPPSDAEVDTLFTGWGAGLGEARKYLPAARNYLAASLWRRIGLRITETCMLDVRDWHPDLGEFGKLHVRYGKGARGRGPATRVVPAINSVAALLTWWLTDVRHQFGDGWSDPDAPLLPSERHDPLTGRCARVGDDVLRGGLASAVGTWLPAWSGRLSPHGLRHYCASSMYARGLDLKAIQDVLGHAWLSSTTRYIHVSDEHIERSWTAANQRVATRLDAEQR